MTQGARTQADLATAIKAADLRRRRDMREVRRELVAIREQLTALAPITVGFLETERDLGATKRSPLRSIARAFRRWWSGMVAMRNSIARTLSKWFQNSATP